MRSKLVNLMLSVRADDLVTRADVSLGLGQLQFRQVLETHLLQHGQGVRVHFDRVSVVDYGDLRWFERGGDKEEENNEIRLCFQVM